MQINSINNQNFGARIVIRKPNIEKLEDVMSDSSILSSTTGLITTGSRSEIFATAAGSNYSAQTPQSAFIPELATKILPDAIIQKSQIQLLSPEHTTINENSAISTYSSGLGALLQCTAKKIFNFCEFFTPNNKNRNFLS